MRPLVLLAALAIIAGAKPVRLDLPDGSAEFEWISPSTFRVLRTWHENHATPADAATRTFESGILRVEFEAGTLNAKVSTESGKPLAELGSPTKAPGKILLDRKLAAGEHILGRTGASPHHPFFFSTAGFGQLVRGGQKYIVDVQPERLRVTAQGGDRIEYFFFYGPAPKDIYDQRKLAIKIPDSLPVRTIDPRKLTCDALHALNADSLAAELYTVSAGPEWENFMGAYTREIFDRGLPVFRPLVLEYPRDTAAWRWRDVTMFGDEMLVAPRCASPLTLPQGLWTDLKTDVEHKSRSTVVLSDPVTIFARNGSIVPVQHQNVLELHYFPKLGAEFFLYEPDVNEYSQAHASQAADFWRLEIESKVARTYEWVLHHIGENPKRIRVEVKAGQDHILNLPI